MTINVYDFVSTILIHILVIYYLSVYICLKRHDTCYEVKDPCGDTLSLRQL